MNSLINREVLVLNKAWRPVNILKLEDAIGKIFAGRAKIIDPNDGFLMKTWEEWAKIKPSPGEKGLRTTADSYRYPEVIVLTEYNQVHKGRVAFSRKHLYRRDDYQCMYCGDHPGTENLSVDHVYPKRLGGQSTWENCVLACIKCNSKKADKTLKEAKMKLLKEPTVPAVSGLRPSAVRCKTWEDFLSTAYWEVELEN